MLPPGANAICERIETHVAEVLERTPEAEVLDTFNDTIYGALGARAERYVCHSLEDVPLPSSLSVLSAVYSAWIIADTNNVVQLVVEEADVAGLPVTGCLSYQSKMMRK